MTIVDILNKHMQVLQDNPSLEADIIELARYTREVAYKVGVASGCDSMLRVVKKAHKKELSRIQLSREG